MIWPGINSAIDEWVSKCSTCQQHQRSNQREPLIPQEVPERPWVTVEADICEFYYRGRDHLLEVDYFSKYPEVVRLSSKNSEADIMAMKDMFARHGIPEKLIADKMPFNSLKFKDLKKLWISAFLVHPNFHSCFYKSIETRYMFYISCIKLITQIIRPSFLAIRSSRLVTSKILQTSTNFDYRLSLIYGANTCLLRHDYYSPFT